MKEQIFRKISIFTDFLRTKYWKFWVKKFGENSRVHGRIVVHYPESLEIGNYSTINEGVIINARAPIIIGSHVHISYGSIITSGGLKLNENYRDRTHSYEKIIIQDGAWIGSGALILEGVIIGEGSVVAAGSVVTKDVEPYTVVAGTPAKFLKKCE